VPTRDSRRHFVRALATACAAAVPVLAALAWPASAAASAAAGPASSVRYVALGDSYSAGLGAGGYLAASGSCHRSADSYPALWAGANQPASYLSVACAGATTGTVLSSQIQALSPATTLVSITIGGNDVGFSAVMETCVLRSTSSCVSAITAAEAKMASQLPGELDQVLNAISLGAPGARVVVLGYPHLYDLARSAGCIGLSTTDRTDLNLAADLLDARIQAAAARHGDVYADVRSAFAAHEICDSGGWLHAVNIFDIAESYHPTAAGQSGGYLPVFSANARWPVRAGTARAGPGA
jgi:lysophospholipase L1-like esterase